MAEIKADIDTVKAISQEIKALSWKLGYAGQIAPLATVIQSTLIYGKGVRNLAEDELGNFHCLVNVFNWLSSGGKTAFLQDADTLIMRAPQLLAVLKYLKETFPSLERITSYARAKSIVKKTPEELSQLHQAGLSRLHIGLETGDDELLSYVGKGVTAEEHMLAGKKALAAGFQLSEYVMPGLGGKKWWRQHAQNTACVLNQINPHFIRLRPYVPKAGTPMFEDYQKGEFELTSPHERLLEIGLMIRQLEVTSRICFDHAHNPSYWSGNRLIPLLKQDYDGYKLSKEKETVLEIINEGLRMNEASFLDAKDLIGRAYL